MKNTGIYENFAQHSSNDNKTTDHHKKQTIFKCWRLTTIFLTDSFESKNTGCNRVAVANNTDFFIML